MAGSRRLTALSQSAGDRPAWCAEPDDARGARLFQLPEDRSVQNLVRSIDRGGGGSGSSCGAQIPQLPRSTRTRRPAPPPADDEPTPDDDVPESPVRRKGLPPLAPESTSSSVESGMSMSDNEPQSPRQRTAADCRAGVEEFDYPEFLLPEFDYPVSAKNTFIDYPVERPPSLEAFYKERLVKSAPASGVQDSPTPADGPPLQEALLPETGGYHLGGGLLSSSSPVRPAAASAYSGQELVPIAPIGSEACPTMGSVGHPYGRCKPCAFMWKGDGCKSFSECPFCHLCDSGEKKRRRKEKLALRRGVGRLTRNLASVLNLSSPRNLGSP